MVWVIIALPRTHMKFETLSNTWYHWFLNAILFYLLSKCSKLSISSEWHKLSSYFVYNMFFINTKCLKSDEFWHWNRMSLLHYMAIIQIWNSYFKMFLIPFNAVLYTLSNTHMVRSTDRYQWKHPHANSCSIVQHFTGEKDKRKW